VTPAIVWDVQREVFSFSPLPRWYGLLFAAGVLLGFQATKIMNAKDGKGGDFTDRLFVYVMIGTVVGMRLVHCLFYQPEIYLTNPLLILKIWEGGFASHGGFAGVIIAMLLFKRKHADVSFLWIADRAAVGSMLPAAFIRLGNLFNSEMIGTPSDAPWAMLFPLAEQNPVPRHPTQLYEAFGYLTIFCVTWLLYQKTSIKQKEGRLFGAVLAAGWTWRFIVEFFKIEQVDFEKGMLLNMGQLLSLPFIAAGLLLLSGVLGKKSDRATAA
jgi:prolipoprotein diacylglyceryl transferase